ncbi:MAG: (d)CMP kinase [Firmicutes bacterium]|nr:(d)CMP kinase [Bacillota bacterium]
MNIAIDGPAGAGKSTIAKEIAKELKIVYLDTGAMYRATAYYMLNKGIEVSNEEAVLSVLDGLNMDISYENSQQSVFVCGENVTPFIREHAISMGASTVSKIPAVRIKLVALQREIASKNACVLDGRDIGTYVLPNAEVKIFLTADSLVRATRRFNELKEKNPINPITLEEVKADMDARDKQDSSRSFAPLKPAEDSVILDTTNMSIDEVISAVVSLAKKRK